MQKSQKITQSLKGLTPEKILGYREQTERQYSDPEINAIKLAFAELAASRNENFLSETIENWINEFQTLRIEPMEAIKRIRLTKLEKKFGVTYFAEFMNVRLADYHEHYKHSSRIINNIGYTGKLAVPISNDFLNFKKENYEILDELPPDRDSPEGYIYLRDDISVSAFYPARCFKILTKN